LICNFLLRPCWGCSYSIEQQKMNHACHTFCDISKMAVSFSLV
jgi:hypothetical protein